MPGFGPATYNEIDFEKFASTWPDRDPNLPNEPEDMSGIPLPLSRPSKDFRFDPERRFSKERLNAIKRDLDREISSSRNLLPEPEMTTEGEVGLTTSDIARLEEALVAELNAAEKENNIVTSERTFDYVSSEAKIEEAIVSEGPHQNANFAFEKSKDSTNDVGRKATIDLSQGWPAPITRSSGQPREPFSPYLTQATAQDSSIKTEHASIANFSSQRPTRDASLPPLIEDDGSETAQGSRQTSADIADDEALAKALVADEYHADETWDRDWITNIQATMLEECNKRKSETPEAETFDSQDHKSVELFQQENSSTDDYMRFLQAKAIMEWEKYLDVNERHRITLHEMMCMSPNEFQRCHEKIQSAFEQVKKDKDQQEFSAYMQNKETTVQDEFSAFQADLQERFGNQVTKRAVDDDRDSDNEQGFSDSDEGDDYAISDDSEDDEEDMVFQGRQ